MWWWFVFRVTGFDAFDIRWYNIKHICLRCVPHYTTEHVTDKPSGSGIHFCIFVTTFYLMLNARSPNKFSKWLYVYLWVMFTLGTSQAITSALLTDKMFITHYGFPGGPVCWLAQNFNGITQIWVSSLVFIAIFLQDVMLVRWRIIRILSTLDTIACSCTGY